MSNLVEKETCEVIQRCSNYKSCEQDENPKRIILEHARWWMNHARMMGFGVWSNKKVLLVPWLWRHLEALKKM